MSTPNPHDRTRNSFSVLGAQALSARGLPEMARSLDKGDLDTVIGRFRRTSAELTAAAPPR